LEFGIPTEWNSKLLKDSKELEFLRLKGSMNVNETFIDPLSHSKTTALWFLRLEPTKESWSVPDLPKGKSHTRDLPYGIEIHNESYEFLSPNLEFEIW
jgi:hypothetical protein